MGWSSSPSPAGELFICLSSLDHLSNLSIVVVVLIISGVALHAHYRNRLAVEVRIDILSEQSPSSYSSLYHRP